MPIVNIHTGTKCGIALQNNFDSPLVMSFVRLRALCRWLLWRLLFSIALRRPSSAALLDKTFVVRHVSDLLHYLAKA